MLYFLVSGSPRSGTSILQQILNTSKEIACLHEYGLLELAHRVDTLFDTERFRDSMYAGLETAPIFYSSNNTKQQSLSNDEAPSLRENDFDPAPIPIKNRHFSKIIDAIFAATFDKRNLRAAGDKIPNIIDTAYLEELQSFYPGIKLLLIVRHPANVIKSSLVRAAAAKDKLDSWHIETFEEALDEWIKNWEFAARIHNLSSCQYYIVKYEDIRVNFDEEMKSIAEFLKVSNGFTNLIQSEIGVGDKHRLSADQEFCLTERIGSLLEDWQSKKISNLLENHPILPYIVSSGELLSASAGGKLSHILRDGFYPIEEFGAWTSGTRARVIFQIRAARPIENVWIDISFMGYVGDMSDFVFGVTVNSYPIEMINVEPVVALGGGANIGRLYEISNGLVEILLSVPRPKRSEQLPLEDTRKLGLWIKSIRATIL